MFYPGRAVCHRIIFKLLILFSLSLILFCAGCFHGKTVPVAENSASAAPSETNIPGDTTHKIAIVSSTPAANASDVDPELTLSVTFADDVSLDAFKQSNVSLQSTSGEVSGDLSIDTAANSISFKPKDALAYARPYVLHVKGAYTDQSNTDDFQLRFTTRASPPQQINSDMPADLIVPLLSYDQAGNGVAIWSTNGGQSASYHLVAAVYDADSKKWSSEIQLGFSRYGYSASVVSNGNDFVVAWLYQNSILARSYNAQNKRWSDTFSVSPEASATTSSSQISPFGEKPFYLLADGEAYLLAWIERRDLSNPANTHPLAAMMTRLTKSAEEDYRASAPFEISSALSNFEFALARNAYGVFASWSEENETVQKIMFRQYDAGTQTWAEVSSPYSSTTAISDIKLAANTTTLAITWQESVSAGVDVNALTSAIDNNATLQWSDPQLLGVSNYHNGSMHLGAGAENFVLAWEYESNIFATVFASNAWGNTDKILAWSSDARVFGIADLSSHGNDLILVTGSPYKNGHFSQVDALPDFSSRILKYANQTWSSAQSIAGINNDINSPTLAFDSNDFQLIWAQQNAEGNTEILASPVTTEMDHIPMILSDNQFKSDSYSPLFLRDNANNALAVWKQRVGGKAQVFARAAKQGVWDDTVTQLSQNTDNVYGKLLAASNGENFLIAWTGATKSYWQIYSATNGWYPDAEIEIPNSSMPMSKQYITAIGSNYVLFGYTQNSENLSISELTSTTLKNGAWTAPQKITQTENVFNEMYLAHTASSVGLVWQEKNLDNKIFRIRSSIGALDENQVIHWRETQTLIDNIDHPFPIKLASSTNSYVLAWNRSFTQVVGDSKRLSFKTFTRFYPTANNLNASWSELEQIGAEIPYPRDFSLTSSKSKFSFFWIEDIDNQRVIMQSDKPENELLSPWHDATLIYQPDNKTSLNQLLDAFTMGDRTVLVTYQRNRSQNKTYTSVITSFPDFGWSQPISLPNDTTGLNTCSVQAFNDDISIVYMGTDNTDELNKDVTKIYAQSGF